MQCQGMQYPIENAVLIPLRKPAMAGRIGRILVWHLRPLCAGTQNPQHPIENVARVAPRSTAFFARANLFRLGNVRSNDLPLLVGEVHDQPTNTSSDEWKDPCKRWNNIDRLRTARGYGMRSSSKLCGSARLAFARSSSQCPLTITVRKIQNVVCRMRKAARALSSGLRSHWACCLSSYGQVGHGPILG